MARIDDFLLNRSASFTLDTTSANRTDLTLSKAAATTGNIQGIVSNSAGGAAINGATVKLRDVSGNPIAHTETNPEGRYQFSSIPTGDYRINVAFQGFVTSVNYSVLVQSGITKNINITLTPESRSRNAVYGIVTNQATGAFISGAYAALMADTVSFTDLNIVKTNASGQFILEQIPDSTQSLGFSAEGFYLSDFRTVEISGGTILHSDATLQAYSFSQATVNGVITDQATGLPIAEACVGLYSLNTEGIESLQQVTFTDSDGFYIFGRAPAGTYVIKAKSDQVV